MSLNNAHNVYRRNAVIQRGGEYLVCYHRDMAAWLPSVDDAWRCDKDSPLTKRIANAVSGEIVPLAVIRYWSQESMEAGRFVCTSPMPLENAERLVNDARAFFPRAEVALLEEANNGRR